jgi:segregation and condensation protein A
LIKRDELDVYDIPIHRITESYLGYLEQIRTMSREHGIDINIAGEFLVMAATLMEIKSALLLPRQDEPRPAREGDTTAAQDLADPRFELVQQLLEYKRLKDNAGLLEQQQSSHFNRFPRVPATLDGDDEPPPLDMDEVQVWDLLEAFQRIMKDLGTRGPREHEVLYDETPLHLHAADIQDRLTRELRLSLRSIMVERKTKSEMIGMFLALLELIREKKILVEHNAQTDDFEILDAPEEHKKTYVGASLTLSDVEEAPPEKTE